MDNRLSGNAGPKSAAAKRLHLVAEWQAATIATSYFNRMTMPRYSYVRVLTRALNPLTC